jgi:3-hydroxybutyryl-CoA dehydratase
MRSHPREYLWEDLKVGLRHEFDIVITDAMMAHFLADFGDNNPLHADRAYAIDRGFRDRVVHGMLTAAFYSTLAGVHLPGRFCLLHSVNVSFHRPVFVGDHLLVSGEVRYLNDACRQAEIAAEITDDHGIVVSKAKLRVGVLAQEGDR